MKKIRNNTFRVVAMLLMLSTAPLGVSYSYAEIEENLELEEIQNDLNLPENSHLDRTRTILTEKVVNGKLKVMELILPKDTTDEDINRILSLGCFVSLSYKLFNALIVQFAVVPSILIVTPIKYKNFF